MALYVCSKCGARADSKCARSRGVFLSDTLDVDGVVIKRHEYPEYGSSVVTLTVTDEVTVEDNVDDEEAVEYILRAMRSALTQATASRIIQAACNHDWRLESDQCELGCCYKEA